MSTISTNPQDEEKERRRKEKKCINYGALPVLPHPLSKQEFLSFEIFEYGWVNKS